MSVFQNKNQPHLSLLNLFHRVDVIEFQLSGSENTVLYSENLYGRVKTEATYIALCIYNIVFFLNKKVSEITGGQRSFSGQYNECT